MFSLVRICGINVFGLRNGGRASQGGAKERGGDEIRGVVGFHIVSEFSFAIRFRLGSNSGKSALYPKNEKLELPPASAASHTIVLVRAIIR